MKDAVIGTQLTATYDPRSLPRPTINIAAMVFLHARIFARTHAGN